MTRDPKNEAQDSESASAGCSEGISSANFRIEGWTPEMVSIILGCFHHHNVFKMSFCLITLILFSFSKTG